MVEFALAHGLERVDFGAVLNHTKQKMVNETRDLSYYIYSSSALVQGFFKALLRLTKIQGKDQLQFLKG